MRALLVEQLLEQRRHVDGDRRPLELAGAHLLQALHHLLDTTHVVGHQLAEAVPELGVRVVLLQQVREGADRDERVADLVGDRAQDAGPVGFVRSLAPDARDGGRGARVDGCRPARVLDHRVGDRLGRCRGDGRRGPLVGLQLGLDGELLRGRRGAAQQLARDALDSPVASDDTISVLAAAAGG